MSTANKQRVEETSGDPSASSSSTSQRSNDQRKRRQVTVACNECRKRKVKVSMNRLTCEAAKPRKILMCMQCDGLRPSCSPCDSRDLPCHYEADPDATPIIALKRKFDQLQKHSQDSVDVLDMLRSRPEQEALAILQRIRNSDLASALAIIRDGDILMQQPPLPSTRPHPILPPLNNLAKGSSRDRNFDNTLLPMDRAVADPFNMSEGVWSHQGHGGRFEPKLYLHRPSKRHCNTIADGVQPIYHIIAPYRH